MTRRISVTGILEIEEDEYDSGPSGPLTQEAYDSVLGISLVELDDLTFQVDE